MKSLVVATWLALVGMSAQAEPVLRLFNWNNEIAPATLQRFEQHCHCKVVEDYYGDNEEMLDKLAGGSNGYDLVVPTSYALQALIRQHQLHPLDKATLPNFKNLHPDYLQQNRPFDPGNRYGAPLLASLTVLGYNRDKMRQLAIPTNSWAAVFEPRYLSRIKGKVAVLDSPRDVLGSALLYLGKDPNSTRQADWQAAADVIRKAKPYWGSFNNQTYTKALAGGDVWLVLGYSNDLYQVMNDGNAAKRAFQIGYSVQKEGNVLGLDNLAILQGSRQPELAQQFINFMLDGRNAADVSNLIGSINPNRAAAPFFSTTARHDPTIMMPPGQQKRILLKGQTAAQRQQLEQLWHDIKLGH